MSARIVAVAGAAFIGASVVLFALYTWMIRGETQENRYASYAEARDSLRRGWLPAMLPRSATEIHEWHDLDTNRGFGSFRFDPGERFGIEPLLRPGLSGTIRIDRDPSFAGGAPRDPDKEQLMRDGFEFYSERNFALAISWAAGITYFWSASP